MLLVVVMTVLGVAVAAVTAQCPGRCECFNTTGGYSLLCTNVKLDFVPNLIPANTTDLDLSFNRITLLRPGDFQHLPSLERLFLYKNMITSLPPGVFQNLTSILELYLHDNSLQSLPLGIFKGLTTLQTLRLNNNQLSSLLANPFEGLNLRSLGISGNPILNGHPTLCHLLRIVAHIDAVETLDTFRRTTCPGATSTCYTGTTNTTNVGCYCEFGLYDGTGCVDNCKDTNFSDACSRYPLCDFELQECLCPTGTSLNGKECEAQVRLVDGDTPWSGRLEVLMNGLWTGFCPDNINSGDARVACHQLGYLYEPTSDMEFSNSTANSLIWSDNLNCLGNEANILACPRLPPVLQDCTSSVILNCSSVTSCEDPGDVTKSTRNVTDFNLGSSVTFRCLEGFHMTGASNITCMANGAWSSPRPVCLPTVCGGWPAPLGSYIVPFQGSDSTVGVSRTYRCFPGYNLTGNATIECLADGSWSSPPECNPVSCNGLPLPVNGYLVTSSLNGMPSVTVSEGITNSSFNGTFGGPPLHYRCNGGHRLIGDSIVHCAENGYWSAVSQCAPLPCFHLPTLLNGAIASSSLEDKFGRTLSYRCDYGYKLVGDSTSECLSNGTWSPTPECILMQCDGIPVLVNGKIVGSPFNDPAAVLAPEGGVLAEGSTHASFSGTFESTLHYQCNHGYNMIGNTVSRCLSNGSWSSIPICSGNSLYATGTVAGAASGAAVAAVVFAVIVMFATRPVKKVANNRSADNRKRMMKMEATDDCPNSPASYTSDAALAMSVATQGPMETDKPYQGR